MAKHTPGEFSRTIFTRFEDSCELSPCRVCGADQGAALCDICYDKLSRWYGLSASALIDVSDQTLDLADMMLNENEMFAPSGVL